MSEDEGIPLTCVKTDTDNFTAFYSALETGNKSTLEWAVSRLAEGEVNRSFSYAANDVFKIPESPLPQTVQEDKESSLPQTVQEDLCHQDNTRICAVHYVVMMGYKDSLDVLLENGADPNIKDSYGQTALHILPKSWKSEEKSGKKRGRNFEGCLDTLLAQKGIEINTLDLSGSTPLSRAEEAKWSYMKERMKTFADTAFKSSRKFKDDLLLKYLLKGNLEQFKSTLKSLREKTNISHIINESHGSYTLLQYACRMGKLNIVSELLDYEASPLCKHDINKFSPVMWAAKFGFHKILSKLIKSMSKDDIKKGALMEKDEQSETLLHYAVNCQNFKEDPEVDYYECLQILLEEASIEGMQYISIDAENDIGNTALHVAANCSDLNAFITLLKNGANFAATDYFGLTPLHRISKEDMITILNECVEYDKQKNFHDPEFWIEVNYQIMNAKVDVEGVSESPTGSNRETYFKNCKIGTEMKFLKLVADIYKDKEILHHPVLNILTLLKWSNIKNFFILNIALYILFLLLLLWYIYIYHSSFKSPEKTNEMSNISYPGIRQTALMVIIVSIFCLREIFQPAWSDYVIGIKNLERVTVVFTILLYIVLYIPWEYITEVQITFAVLLILISLLGFILHFEHFPNSSVYIIMLRKVSWMFFIFIPLFIVIILAFSLSFSLVFKTIKNFESLSASLVKTIVMSTGEIEYNELSVSEIPVVSHLLIVFFVYLVLLILMNLLNGLAIGDILDLYKKAEVASCKGQIDRMEELERAFYNKNRKPFKGIFVWLVSKTLIFKTCLQRHRIKICVNKRPIQYILGDKDVVKEQYLCTCHAYTLTTKQIEALKHIVLVKKRRVR